MRTIAISTAWIVATCISTAAEKFPLAKEFWKSDAFLKDFNGSYRVNAQIEPYVTTEDRTLLDKIVPLMAAGKRGDAMVLLQKSTSLSKSAPLQFTLATIAYEEGKLEVAEKAYEKAIDLYPSFLRAYQNLGYLHMQSEQIEKAMPALQKAISLGANDGTTLGLLGYCYQQKNLHQSALTAFRNAMLVDAQNVQWMQGAAYSLNLMGKTSEAITFYRELVALKPEVSRYQVELAQLLRSIEKRDEAIVLLELLSQKKALSFSEEIMLGLLYLEQENGRLAEKKLSAALANLSDQAEVEDLKVSMQAVQYAIDTDAVDLANKLLPLIKHNKPEQQAELLFLQSQISLKQADLAAAKSHLEELFKINPLHEKALIHTGKIHYIEGEFTKAIFYYDRTIAIDGQQTQKARLAKAESLVSFKQYSKAVEELEIFLAIDPSPEVEAYKEAIERVVDSNK